MNAVVPAHSFFPWAAAALAALAVSSCAPGAEAQQLGGPQSIDGPAGAVYVDDGGGTEGLPVVFLHSFAGDTSHWASQLSHLRHHRRALAIDLRGHGKSAAPRDNAYSVAAFAKDVEAAVDALKLKRFVLVGHSLGGAAAMAYAGSHPQRVAGLVLVGAPGKVPAEQAQQVLAAIEANYDDTMKGYWEKLLTGAQPHVRTQLAAQMDAVPKEASLAIVKALFAYDPLPAIDRYNGPALIVYTPQGDTPNDLQNLRPKIPRRAMEGTSHWPHLDRPAEFNQVLDEFLAGVK
jgi:pimeloyl-ACP methyl ester carboxylesterase